MTGTEEEMESGKAATETGILKAPLEPAPGQKLDEVSEGMERAEENGDEMEIGAVKAENGIQLSIPDAEITKESTEQEKEEAFDYEGNPEDVLPEMEEEGFGQGEKSEIDLTSKENNSHEKVDKKENFSKEFVDPLKRPPNGCEVFVGGLARDVKEEDLREIFTPIGQIFEIRVMEDRETGNNKGFGFVTYFTKEDAEKAIVTLSDLELKGKKIRVSKTQPKNRLFIGNVPKHWEKEEFEKIINQQGVGVTSIELLKDPKAPQRNRGFAFVEFMNHSCAESARRALTASSFRLGGISPTVTWAEPRPEPDASAMASVKILYVKGLPEKVTEEQISAIFSKHGEVTKVLLPAPKPGFPKRDFGFVHFAERSQALKALEQEEKYEMEGNVLEVSLARPLPDKKPSHGGGDHTNPSSQRREERSSHHSHSVYHQSSRAGPAVSHGHGHEREREREREDRVGGVGGSSWPYGYRGGDRSERGHERGRDRVGERGSYSQIPIVYGRGPMPAGMKMVAIVLPDGRIGYMFEPVGGGGGRVDPGSYPRDSGRSSRSGGGPSYRNSSLPSKRYRPY